MVNSLLGTLSSLDTYENITFQSLLRFLSLSLFLSWYTWLLFIIKCWFFALISPHIPLPWIPYSQLSYQQLPLMNESQIFISSSILSPKVYFHILSDQLKALLGYPAHCTNITLFKLQLSLSPCMFFSFPFSPRDDLVWLAEHSSVSLLLKTPPTRRVLFCPRWFAFWLQLIDPGVFSWPKWAKQDFPF